MKLSYSIPGKIWWITNFLDYSMYKGIHDAIIKERKKINLQTSKGVWKDSLINNIKPPLRSEVSGYKPFEQLKTLVRHNPYFQIENMVITFYLYKPTSKPYQQPSYQQG